MEKLADDTYTVLNNGANKNTGLVPNWQTWTGSPQGNYGFDACRTPWRIALDYLWNGNEKAKKWCTTISDWAYKIGPKNIKDGYNLDGSSTGFNHNMAFVGAFAVAAMCNRQEVADAFGEEVARMSYDSYWYHAYLGNCYMLALTGNMWKPDLTGNNRSRLVSQNVSSRPKLHLLEGKNIVINGLPQRSVITLNSLSGRCIASARSRDGNASINISSQKVGCYLIAFNDGSGTGARRIIKTY